jgi:Domain of unknown function (DUF4276)
MPTLGLIVEGVYDAAALTEWIKKCLERDIDVKTRLCAQKGSLMRKFPGYLAGFHWDNQGGPVDKAFVVHDAEGKDPQGLMTTMRARIADRLPIFPVEFVVIVQELETWLLADHEAMAKITGRRVPEIHEALEEIRDPKERLQKILSDAGIAYTSEVARKIAAASDLERLAYRCPGFRTFHQAVLDR